MKKAPPTQLIVNGAVNVTGGANGMAGTHVTINTSTELTTQPAAPIRPFRAGKMWWWRWRILSKVTGTGLGAKVVNGQITLNGCFYAGTLLLTTAGEAQPVRWLGRSTVSTKFRDPLHALPIRIKANALGDNLPLRDLLVSTCPAILLGGVLIQAGALVNGETIIRETDVPEVFTYFHVELESHDLLLAEGAAAESFVDNIDRMHFENWAEHDQLNSAPMQEMAYPRVKSFRQIPAAVRAMLGVRQAA